MKILLLILGSPVWLPLLAVLFAVVISVTASLWAGVVALWAGFVAAVVSAPAGVGVGVMNIINGSGAYGSAMIALGIGSAVAAVILFYLSLYATKGMCTLTKKGWEAIISIKERLS